jgi:hypothetical protein
VLSLDETVPAFARFEAAAFMRTSCADIARQPR